MYRINAKKPRLWSFRSSSDLRVCLSTLLKFVESVIPFIKTRMDGIIVTIPGTSPAAKYNKFLDMMIRRSYITSFRSIPVESRPDDEKSPYERMFIIRKGVTPTTLFHSKAFRKYNLTDIVTADSLSDLKMKFPQKLQLKTEPSKKFRLGDHDLDVTDITIDDEIFDQISNLKRTSTVDKAIEKIEEPEFELTKEDFNAIKDYFFRSIKKSIIFTFLPETFYTEYRTWEISKGGKDPNDYISYSERRIYLRTVFTESYKTMIFNKFLEEMPYYREFMSQIKTFIFYGEDIDNRLGLAGYSSIVNFLEDYSCESMENSKNEYTSYKINLISKISKFSKENIVYFFENYENLKKWVLDFDTPNIITKHSYFETNLNPEKLTSAFDTLGSFSYDKIFEQGNEYIFGRSEENEDQSEKKRLISETWGYNEVFDDELTVKEFSIITDYTGSSYSDYNQELRKMFDKFHNKEQYDPYYHEMYGTKINKNTLKMASSFDKMPGLPDAIWVYRGTQLNNNLLEELKKGNIFSDPGFMSTSTKSNNTFGCGNIKFRIYLPKGSKVIPILDRSSNAGEDEIILPPLSTLKIIRMDQFTEYEEEKFYVTAVFVGSAFKDFFDKLPDEIKNLSEETEKETFKTQTPYSANDKFGGTKDENLIKQVLKAIQTKTLKVRK